VSPLLEVSHLRTTFDTGGVTAVDDVSFTLQRGKSVAIVGESGAGKSALAKSLTGLLPKDGVTRSGKVLLDGTDLLKLDDKAMRDILGLRVGVLFQDPMSYLNPVIRIGVQLTERMRPSSGRSKAEANSQAIALLKSVGVPDPSRRLRQYPHELSGGTRQRVAMAIALACDPDLLIADEPTTALDATVQAQVVEMLREQQSTRRMSLLLITHDLRLAADLADDIIVMYAGQIVETGPAARVLNSPLAPYTRALLDAMPDVATRGRLAAIPGEVPDLASQIVGCRFANRCWAATDRCRSSPPALERVTGLGERRCWYPDAAASRPSARAIDVGAEAPGVDCAPRLLTVEALTVSYRTPGSSRRLQALSGVGFDVARGETLGIVGESGCGKSTLAKAIMGTVDSAVGTVALGDVDLLALSPRRLRAQRPRFQMVFQDPHSSLNPLRHVKDIVREPLEIWGRGSARSRAESVASTLRLVGLDPDVVGDRQPHQLSGGQAQRVAIARALILEPELLVCDEPVSALDVSVQAQIVNLLARLKRELNLTMLFISHDLAVVNRVADRVIVMYLGKIVESGAVDEIFSSPRHPYTAALLAAGGQGSGIATELVGEVPSPTDIPSGCRFNPRCPQAQDRCRTAEPVLIGASHSTACHFPLETLS
jgi:peptide/nickel transport system ATP-binding protein